MNQSMYSLVLNRGPPPPINLKKIFQPARTFLFQPSGYYILGKIPSNTSFQDIYSFCIDENKTNIT